MTVRASSAGYTTKTQGISLTVNPPGTFTISVSPTSSTVTQGNSATYSVTVFSQNGFNSGVLLEVLNLPSGYVASGTGYSPGPTVTPPANGSITSTLTIVTNASTTTGLASMTVRASSAGQTTQTQGISLTVNPPNQTGT